VEVRAAVSSAAAVVVPAEGPVVPVVAVVSDVAFVSVVPVVAAVSAAMVAPVPVAAAPSPGAVV
jgi:hypothetical protein